VDYTLGTPEFQKQLSAAPMKGGPLWGTKFKTALVIMDEGEEVQFRNLRVRPLFEGMTPSAPVPGPEPAPLARP
jgi:hypothetical protein